MAEEEKNKRKAALSKNKSALSVSPLAPSLSTSTGLNSARDLGASSGPPPELPRAVTFVLNQVQIRLQEVVKKIEWTQGDGMTPAQIAAELQTVQERLKKAIVLLSLDYEEKVATAKGGISPYSGVSAAALLGNMPTTIATGHPALVSSPSMFFSRVGGGSATADPPKHLPKIDAEPEDEEKGARAKSKSRAKKTDLPTLVVVEAAFTKPEKADKEKDHAEKEKEKDEPEKKKDGEAPESPSSSKSKSSGEPASPRSKSKSLAGPESPRNKSAKLRSKSKRVEKPVDPEAAKKKDAEEAVRRQEMIKLLPDDFETKLAADLNDLQLALSASPRLAPETEAQLAELNVAGANDM